MQQPGRYQKGARVRVRRGQAHDDMTRDAVGTVVEVAPTPALGIRFDGMEGVHRWYVDGELEPADDGGGAMGAMGSMPMQPMQHLRRRARAPF